MNLARSVRFFALLRQTIPCSKGREGEENAADDSEEVPTYSEVVVCVEMRLLGLLGALFCSSAGVYAASLRVVNVSTLGVDPNTTNHLNGESFQQDALVTFNGASSPVLHTCETSDNLLVD